jgi:putative phage-type endonuclease
MHHRNTYSEETMDRKQFLGGSDAAVIFGVSPWRTPLELWRLKTGQVEEAPLTDEKRRFFQRRKEQEPVIARMLEAEGVPIVKLSLDAEPNRYIHPQLTFLAAEIDFETRMTPALRERVPTLAAIPDGTPLNGEIKTVHPFKASEWGEEGSEEVPIHYVAQAWHGQIVTGAPATVVAALFGLDNLVLFGVLRDEDALRAMLEREIAFWREHVLPRVPPPPVSYEDVALLYRKWRGKPADVDAETFAAVTRLAELRAAIKANAAEEEELKRLIGLGIYRAWGLPPETDDPVQTALEDAQLRFEGRPFATWKRQRGAYLDQKRLKEAFPDVVKAYTIETVHRTLRITKG